MPKGRSVAAIVLAAGEGKRFRSDTPKVLHDLCGRPLLAGVLDVVSAVKPTRTVLVVGRGADEVEQAARAHTKLSLTVARQKQLLGTADAVRVADESLGTFDGDVIILAGDTPLLTVETMRGVLARHQRSKAAATIVTAHVEPPRGYGRIVRAADGAVERIVEEVDASAAERRITEINSGTYVFDRAALRAALTKVERANRQGEYYLTDVIAVLREKGERIEAVVVDDAAEVLGVNDRVQLAAAAAVVRRRTNERLMGSGVTIVDPAQTWIDPSVKVGRDTVIHPMTSLAGSTVIGSGCEIGPSARITNSKVADRASVQFAVLDGADVGREASVGPFAYLRPGAKLKSKAKVGTFVEVKNATIGEGSKVPHLSYIGDATIGKDVNIGASSVTLNYDAETKTKSRTIIGDEAKIGGDTMLVAPVKVGRGAVTGAGSIVTRDVPAETLVYGAPAKSKRKRKRPKGEST